MRQKLNKNANLSIYSRITKLEHENRERNFQVFISGANKERLKIRDIQQEALQTKKAQIARKPKAPENALGRRKIWHKSSEIKIKGSNGSDFALVNQKHDTKCEGVLLHDITPKINFHLNSQKHSQLDLIRNRYKAYFHIDGYGFCCSKETSNPSTPAKYKADGASLISNRSSLRHQQQIKDPGNLTLPQLFDNEEQRNQYYGLVDKNNTLREFLTPDYEFFKTAKEIRTISDSPAIKDNSCNGIVYDVFYHKDRSISHSAKALFLTENKCDDGHAKDDDDQPRSIDHIFEKNEGGGSEESAFYQDERALVLLENQVLDDNLGMPPLEKALSPIAKLVKSSYNYNEEKKSHPFSVSHCHNNKSIMDRRSNLKLNLRYLCEFNNFPKQPTFLDPVQSMEKESHPHNDNLLSNRIMNCGMEVENNPKSNLKLNLRYLRKFENVEKPAFLDLLQSNVGDGTSDDDDGSSQTQECESTTPTSLTPKSDQTWKSSGLEKVDFVEDVTWKSSPVSDRESTKSSNFSSNIERITKTHGTLLSDRVKKLDIRRQMYLANILDKLEISNAKSGSADLGFCHSCHLLT